MVKQQKPTQGFEDKKEAKCFKKSGPKNKNEIPQIRVKIYARGYSKKFFLSTYPHEEFFAAKP